MSKICSICTIVKENVIDIKAIMSSNNFILEKLQKFIPEVEWQNELSMCSECLNKLEIAYNFRELCLNSKDQRRAAVMDDNKNFLAKINTLEFNDPQVNLGEYDSKSQKKNTNQGKAVLTEQKPDAYQCSICRAKFSKRNSWKRHQTTVHITEKKFKCEICARPFASSSYLTAHMKYHAKEKKFMCLHCGQKYKTMSNLYHHKKIHAPTRKYQCSECKNTFKTSSGLYKHKQCVHPNLRSYKCEFCDLKFHLKKDLSAHIPSHENISTSLPNVSSSKSCKCTFCDLLFQTEKLLAYHVTNEHDNAEIGIVNKENHIPWREDKASNTVTLQKEEETSDIPTLKCPKCEKRFIYKIYLNLHLSNSHNHDA